ncbi:gas vesicle protein [Halobacteriales archaeon QS_4_69_34]|nr:MAG: gas vesicle protein [Halobacteriales archaeon QS_4_69_34]
MSEQGQRDEPERSGASGPTRHSGGAGPARRSDGLADVLEMVLDKGVVVNADIAVSVGDTELLGIQLRAAIASFETAAEYGLEFPTGTDMRRVERASGREPLPSNDHEEGAIEGGEGDDGSVQTALEGASGAVSDADGVSTPGLSARPSAATASDEGGEGGTDADGGESEVDAGNEAGGNDGDGGNSGSDADTSHGSDEEDGAE